MSEAKVYVRSSGPQYLTAISNGRHHLAADEPAEKGGADAGTAPYELLLSSLGACTSITLRMYAARKGWKLEEVRVELELSKGDHTQISRTIGLEGELSEEQRTRLLEIAKICPVAKVLQGGIRIESTLKN